jgi:deoxyribonuclease V
MLPSLPQRWDLPLAEARALQESMRARVEARDRLRRPPRHVAGLDVSYDRGSPVLFAAVVVLDAESLELVDSAAAVEEARFPYVPGFLSFREIPPLLRAFENLRVVPDLLLCDGHGFAHPRRFGLACHLGVVMDLPSIGSAKSRLAGEHEELGLERGARAPLTEGGETIGTVLRTRARVSPVYVSVGHRVSLESAVGWVLRLAPRYRVPEPIRRAHMRVNELRREGWRPGGP